MYFDNYCYLVPQPEIGVSSHSLPLLQRRRRNKGKLCSSIYEPALSLFLVHLLLLPVGHNCNILLHQNFVFSPFFYLPGKEQRQRHFCCNLGEEHFPLQLCGERPAKAAGDKCREGTRPIKTFLPRPPPPMHARTALTGVPKTSRETGNGG